MSRIRYIYLLSGNDLWVILGDALWEKMLVFIQANDEKHACAGLDCFASLISSDNSGFLLFHDMLFELVKKLSVNGHGNLPPDSWNYTSKVFNGNDHGTN